MQYRFCSSGSRCSVQLDFHAQRGCDANTLGVSDEEHRQPRRDVAKRESLRQVNEVPQTAAQRANDRVRDVRLVAIEKLEGREREKDELAIFDSRGRRGIRTPVEDRQLGHGAAWSFDVQHLLAPRRVGAVDPNASGCNHVEPAAFLAGREQQVPGPNRPRHAPARERLQCVVGQFREERNAVQEFDEGRLRRAVFGHDEGISPPEVPRSLGSPIGVTTVTRLSLHRGEISR